MPVEGGAVTQVLPDVFRADYVVTKKGVYFIPRAKDDASYIGFLDFASGKQSVIVKTKTPELGLGISPDGRTLIYSQVDYVGRDLMLVENFR